MDRKFHRLPFILITSLFLIWGLANNMTDTLLAAFKRIMGMTDFQTSWIQIAFYGSYFCLAIPAALYIKRFSYKSGVLLGLGLFISGSMLFYPASISMRYGHFLVALFVLAGGLPFWKLRQTHILWQWPRGNRYPSFKFGPIL